MTRAELAAAVERVIDAERFALQVTNDDSRTGAVIVAKREVRDARADLEGMLDVLDHELAFEPELAVKP